MKWRSLVQISPSHSPWGQNSINKKKKVPKFGLFKSSQTLVGNPLVSGLVLVFVSVSVSISITGLYAVLGLHGGEGFYLFIYFFGGGGGGVGCYWVKVFLIYIGVLLG
jgi:hypothetical protein